jgi:four helix bundle protein
VISDWLVSMFKFEELRIYQDALKFVEQIYLLTGHWPKDEIFGLTNQLRRAAVSIVLNIAEGSGRTRKDFRHFLDMARSSCYECVAILTIARNRKYITEEEFNEMYEWCGRLARSLSALKGSLR